MFRRAAIFREEYITLLYKTLETLKCAVHATRKIFLKYFSSPKIPTQEYRTIVGILEDLNILRRF
jgi:hypothetical protein